MKIAILCPTATGHLNPMTTLAGELSRRNHQVIFYQLPDGEAAVSNANMSVRIYGASGFPKGEWVKLSQKLGELEGKAALNFSVEAFAKRCRIGLTELPQMLKADQIECIVADQVGLETSTIAEILKTPFITVCNALPIESDSICPPFFTSWKSAEGVLPRIRNSVFNFIFEKKMNQSLVVVNEFRNSHGLTVLQSRKQAYSKRLQLVQIPQEVDFLRQPSSIRHWVGPLVDMNGLGSVANTASKVDEFPWEKLDGRPIVYVSMGTEMNRRPEIFQTISDALADLPCQLVVSLGRRGSDTSKLKIRPGDLVLDYVPQKKLLPKCKMFVTHAGVNSALESLLFGIPMLCIPANGDQFGMAARIEFHDLGLRILKNEFNIETLRNRVNRLLTEEKFSENCKKMEALLGQRNPPALAADLIERNHNGPSKLN